MALDLSKKGPSQKWEDTLTKSDDYVKDMLSFFQEGWDARGADDKAKIRERLKANVVTTLTYTHEVINALLELEIAPRAVFIKGESYVSQTVLISVGLEDYLSDNFSKIYQVSNKIEQSSKSENYIVNFSFTFDDGSLSIECLSSDGYVNTHTFD